MLAHTTHCDHDRLRSLLDGELPEPAEAECMSHVESCAPCRQHLESLAADAEMWSETKEMLSNWKLGTLARPSSEHEPERDEERTGKSAHPPFLAPSDNPAMLGRLGEFDVLEIIGRGGMGIVLKGYDHELNRWIAIKVLGPQYAENAAARKRFAREAQAAAAVVHPHVIGIHAVDAAHQPPYFVMPFVPGESLQQRIDRVGTLDVSDVLRISQQVAEGLAAAHAQGLVHRDIKPANILLERNVERVVITDFGLARAMDDASLTQSGVIAGTPQYMSPEQARGESVDARTDLFSLGSVMYAMLTGHPPFRADTPWAALRRVTDQTPRPLREINAAVPDWLEAFIGKLHAKSADARFASASEVAELLKCCLAHLEQPSRIPLPTSVTALITHPASRRATWLIALSLLLVFSASLRLCVSAFLPIDPQSNNTPQRETQRRGDAETQSWEDQLRPEIEDLRDKLKTLEYDFDF